MGIGSGIKKAILSSAMNKRKKQNPFDANYSDNYKLPENADSTKNNSHYLSVHNLKTKEAFFLRLGLRGGDAQNEVWLVFKTKDGSVYMAEKDHYPKGQKVPAEVSIIEGGKTIRFLYDGIVKKAKRTDKGYVPDLDSADLPLRADFVFTANTECFEFSRHMTTEPVARAFSQEKFTKEFRASLSENHQVHYEQSGYANGSVQMSGEEVRFLDTPAFRDHSYGKRDWNYFDRYVWMVANLENGDFIHTSLIRYPVVSHLQTGFYKTGGKTVCLKKSTSMDDLPVTGSVPEQFEFDVVYADKTVRHIKCKLDFVCPFVFGDGTYLVNEGVSEFDVDGVKGRGITEFAFNSDASRWTREKK